MGDWKKTLEGLVGVKGIKTLSKAIHRRDSDSTIGPLDVYLPLLVVPRAILSWLVQNIKPIPVGETEKLEFPGMPDVEIVVEKVGRDSYRGEFLKDGKVIHSFDKQTLPNVGGNLMTIGEMYDAYSPEETGHVHDLPFGGHTEGPESRQEADFEDAVSPDISMPHAMMSMVQPQPDNSKLKEMDSAVLLNLTHVIGKLTDALVSNHLTEKRVAAAISSVKDEEEKIDKAAMDETGKCKETKVREYNEPEIRHIKDKTIEKTMHQEGPSGQAGPSRATGELKPEKPSFKQNALSSQSYFKKRLDRSRNVAKKDKEYFISDSELYTPCIHCGTAEFKKTESGPKYKPCACFYVTLKTEEGKAASFVRVTRKSEGGYSLSFSKDADKETIDAFLMTLKNKLLKHKDSLS